jgi:hypothetical protein
MMDRRDFVKFIALLAAGAAARPEQIAAFERYYDINTPAAGNGFVAVDEVILGGMATTSMPVLFTLLRDDERVMRFGYNAFGGIVRWAAMPDQKIVAASGELRWQLDQSDATVKRWLTGQINYIDQDGRRQFLDIETAAGVVA